MPAPRPTRSLLKTIDMDATLLLLVVLRLIAKDATLLLLVVDATRTLSPC